MTHNALIIKLMLVITAVTFVTACSHVRMGTLWAMRDVDFKTIDPSVVRLALAMPEGADFERLVLELDLRRKGELVRAEKIKLDVIKSGPEVDRVGFPVHVRNGIVIKIPAERVAAIEAFRQQMVLLDREKAEGSLSIGINSKLSPQWIKRVCSSGIKRLRIKSWILVEEKQGYLPLLKDSMLGRMIRGKSDDLCQQVT